MKPQGLPKEFRLLKRADFLPRGGRFRKINTESFRIVCTDNNRSSLRIGIVASKKVGNAVTRNRVKRLVREFFRLNRDRIHLRGDIIVIAKPKARIDRYVDVEKELKRLL